MNGKIRILAAKPGLDGHDRGIKVICHGLRDAGMEVVYTGLRQSPEQIVETAVQEDADVIALSILSGAHNHLLPKVAGLLKKREMDDVLLLAGGIIPEEDVAYLKEKGISEVFGPGTMIGEIETFIKNTLSES